jgi:hypothetical protein
MDLRNTDVKRCRKSALDRICICRKGSQSQTYRAAVLNRKKLHSATCFGLSHQSLGGIKYKGRANIQNSALNIHLRIAQDIVDYRDKIHIWIENNYTHTHIYICVCVCLFVFVFKSKMHKHKGHCNERFPRRYQSFHVLLIFKNDKYTNTSWQHYEQVKVLTTRWTSYTCTFYIYDDDVNVCLLTAVLFGTWFSLKMTFLRRNVWDNVCREIT